MRIAGDIVAAAVLGPDACPWHAFACLKQGEAGGVVATRLRIEESGARFEEREEQSLLGGSGADGPGGDAIDGGIEEIQAEVGALESTAAHNFLEDGACWIIEDDDMVAIPANPSADMSEEAWDKLQDAGDFVPDRFRGMEMSGIEAEAELVANRVGQIELVRADSVGFHSQAKEFAFDCIDVKGGVERFRKDGIERLLEAQARASAIDRQILKPVWYPDVGNGGGSRLAAHFRPYAATGDAVANPEITHIPVCMGQGEAVGGHGVGETGWIEVQSPSLCVGPIDPALKVDRLQLVPSGQRFSISVDGVQVEAKRSWNESCDLFQILAQFRGGTGASRVVSGGHDAPSPGRVARFKTRDVIPLPAMQ